MSFVKCCFDTELPNVLDSVVKKCTDPGCCCVCCSALRPRYKRLVDNIFPALPQDGLVKNNMEKLTFYSLSSPEKLDRIGEYLFQRASRDINRRRTGFVVIAMEAMDQLLVACHAQTLNLFVESFLKMVQKLLESTEPQLQVLATQSFVRFANIEEDTPSYHRRYDFFVSKFSSMCHNNNDDPDLRDKIRSAGIGGLQGVVRKTVSDDLVENIWEAVHMDKIVPSLLYNMQNSRYHNKEADTPEPPHEEHSDPPALAETCMRELIGRASFGHIRCVLRPVLRHLDLHQLWVPNHFAIHTFRIIMFSIQAQYSYAVVETLMAHLDSNSKSSPKIRTSIADVLSKIIAIAAGESVGPSVLEINNSLLMHLRVSVTREVPADNAEAQKDEKLYQEALINALGEFANHLPDYQKIEIMMFIMSKVPYPSLDHLRGFNGPGDVMLQNILLKSLLKVGTKYKTIHFNTTFPMSFLEPLLRMSLAADPDMRILVQKILHTLVDRHSNLKKLLKPTRWHFSQLVRAAQRRSLALKGLKNYASFLFTIGLLFMCSVHVSNLDLTVEKCSRPDIIFIRKHGHEIYLSLYESLEQANNTVENIEAVYTTLALLTVEIASEDTVTDLLMLLNSIQDMALTNATLSSAQKFNLHAVVLSLLVLIPHVVSLPSLLEYAEKILEARRANAPHLLPELSVRYDLEATTIPSDLLVDKSTVANCLHDAGVDSTRLNSSAFTSQHRHSWADGSMRGTESSADLNVFQMEVDSAASSPGVERKQPEEKLTVESMKKILSDTPKSEKLAEEEKKSFINKTFRTAAFEELFSRTHANKSDILQNKLNEIFSKLPVGSLENIRSPPTPTPSLKQEDVVRTNPPAYEVLFPELFVY